MSPADEEFPLAGGGGGGADVEFVVELLPVLGGRHDFLGFPGEACPPGFVVVALIKARALAAVVSRALCRREIMRRWMPAGAAESWADAKMARALRESAASVEKDRIVVIGIVE